MATSLPPLRTQLAWHGLALLILACLPLLRFRVWWWGLQPGELLPLAVLLGAYAGTALTVMLFVRDEGWSAAVRALAVAMSVTCIVVVAALLIRFALPRYLLLPVFLATAIIMPLSVSPWARLPTAMALLSVAVLGTVALAAAAVIWDRQVPLTVTESFIKTAFYGLRVVSREGVVPLPATRGGGLDRLGDQILLSTGDGDLYLLTREGDDLKAMQLQIRVPANREEFAAAFGGSAEAPRRWVDYREIGKPRVQTWRFRVADVIAQSRGDTVRIFASHHFWKSQEGCFTVRVSALEAERKQLYAVTDDGWKTIFEASPCIPMTGKYRKRGKNPFRGEEIGGRMVLLDENTLLLTLGDHGFYGAESVQAFSQDPQADYGKTIRIDLNTHEKRIYTLGHRNPQGLYVDPDRRIWLTEHGSQGGDELNLLVEGANYGWPRVTYGTDYGALAWQFNPRQGRHDGYVQPVLSWVPSIGASNLIGLERDRFAIWKGDLIASSLATRSLYRLTLDGTRVVVSEPIAIGKRIRDLLELDDGRLLLWTDEALLITLEQSHDTGGALGFAILCSGCHQITDGMSHRLGPDLHGIVGRKVASARGFGDYSTALKEYGGVWSTQRLDEFLRDPQSAVPGTTMAFDGIEDDEARAAVIAHMEEDP